LIGNKYNALGSTYVESKVSLMSPLVKSPLELINHETFNKFIKVRSLNLGSRALNITPTSPQ